MGIRMTGLTSGLDTEAIVEALMSAQKMKTTKVKNKLTNSEWTGEIWKDLNKKLYSFYTTELTKFKTQGSYLTKKATSSNNSVATATATNSAGLGSHSLAVKSLASAQMVTGAKIEDATSSTKSLTDLGIKEGTVININGCDGKSSELKVTDTTTIADFVDSCKAAGLNATFDTNQKRLFISSGESGKENGFSITTSVPGREYADKNINALLENASSATASVSDLKNAYKQLQSLDETTYAKLQSLNLDDPDEVTAAGLSQEQADAYRLLKDNLTVDELSQFDTEMTKYIKNENTNGVVGASQLAKLGLDEIDSAGKTSDDNITGSALSIKWASDAVIVLDGAELTGSSNSFAVNGLTLNLTATTKNEATGKYDEISLNVSNDAKTAYDMVKNFVKKYNELLDEMNTKYSAKSARDYEPLTDEQKEAMSEDEVEKWETKIKDSLLRRDDTLSGIVSTMRSSLQINVEVDGKNYSLSSFGIKTSSDYTEKGKLHICGDEEDDTYATDDNKLMEALENNPEAVMKTLAKAGQNLYDALTKKMSKTSLSSALTFYNDKQMENTQKEYKKRIKEMEDKLADLEDRYYKQFTAMETALTKMQNTANSVMGFFGS